MRETNRHTNWTKIYMALREIYGEEEVLRAFTVSKLTKMFIRKEIRREKDNL